MAMIDVLLPGNNYITQADEACLLKLEGGYENDTEICTWVQYHLKESGIMVHRSAHLRLKEGIFAASAVA